MTGRWFKGVVSIGCFLIAASNLCAQEVKFRSTGYTTQNSTLSHNTVLNVFQDSRGFLWIGTMDGLNRFDGQDFKLFRHNRADSTSLSDSFIHGIYERSNGKLWIGTRDGGYNILDPVTDQITRITHNSDNSFNIPNRPANLMYEDSQGLFWIGFFASSIGIFDDSTQKFIPINLRVEVTNEPVNSVNSVLELGDGSLLFSSLEGLYYIPAEELVRYSSNPSTETQIFVKRIIFNSEKLNPETNVLYLDKNMSLWAELVGVGFKKADSSLFPNEVLTSIQTGVKGSSAKNVVIERDEFLLFGAGGGYLQQIDKISADIKLIKVSDSELTGAARLYVDNQENYWFATWGGGLLLLEEQKGIELYSSKNGLQSDFILAFTEEENGTWVGTNSGLAFLSDDGEITPYNNAIEGFSNQSIWSLWRDDLGLWVSTRFDGLYFISEESIKEERLVARNFNPSNSLIQYEDIQQVLRDSRGWLWLGYQGDGVQIIKNVEAWLQGAPADIQELHDETTEPSINSRSVRRFYEDDDGNMWIATTDNGYNYVQFNEQEIIRIKPIEPNSDLDIGLSHPDGRSIYQQNDSTFWFASYGGAITRWNSKSNQFLNLTTNDGLANNSTYGILPDLDRRYLWVSTNNGISRLDTETLKFTTFTTADGLQNNEFNTGAFFKKPDGRLVFGGVGGFNMIDTDELTIDREPPAVFISGINVFNEPLRTDTSVVYLKQLKLPYDQNFLSFEFSAIDLSQPEFVQFAYKVEGIDDDWVLAGNRNFADYPNLKPGHYILRVKAANSDGFWNHKAASMEIVITPPWWQTLLFRIIAACSIITLFGFTIRYYAQRQLKEQIRKMELSQKLRDERERISRDLHDHVGAQLANIMSGLSLVDKYNEFDEKEKSTELMHSLKGDAEVTIKQLRETIWALNQNELNVEEFSTHLKDYFKNQSALTTSLKVQIDVESGEKAQLSSAQALNLFRIIQEASQNTLKYADAENLNIRINQTNGQLGISIKDDGIFKSNGWDFNGGYGLKNMQKRANEINSEISINTDTGTEIVMKIPLQ